MFTEYSFLRFVAVERTVETEMESVYSCVLDALQMHI